MPIAYEELVGSCSAQFASGGVSDTRIFKVAWSDAFDFAGELYGRYSTWPEGGYVLPARFPYRLHLYCDEVNIEGIGITDESSNADGTYTTYLWAKVTARYSPMTGVDPEDPEVVEEESISVAADIGTAEDGAWEYTADNVIASNSAMPAITEPTMLFTVTRFHVSALPESIIAATAGAVNNATWRGFSAGYVLFIGADARRSITTDGAEDWEVAYFFKTKTHNWNHVYRSEDGHYEAVRTKVGHDPMYATATFTDLGV